MVRFDLQTMRAQGNNMAYLLKNLKCGGQPIPERETGFRINFSR